MGSTDFWGISFAPSSFELAPMPEEELERKMALLEAAWRFFDDVAARVSPELEKGPRGGGRNRDQIVRHVVGNERGDLARKVGVTAPFRGRGPPRPSDRTARSSSRRCATTTPRPKMARGRNWTIPLLLRHTAYHVLDHAWEMEDKDLSSAQSNDAKETADGSARPRGSRAGRASRARRQAALRRANRSNSHQVSTGGRSCARPFGFTSGERLSADQAREWSGFTPGERQGLFWTLRRAGSRAALMGCEL